MKRYQVSKKELSSFVRLKARMFYLATLEAWVWTDEQVYIATETTRSTAKQFENIRLGNCKIIATLTSSVSYFPSLFLLKG